MDNTVKERTQIAKFMEYQFKEIGGDEYYWENDLPYSACSLDYKNNWQQLMKVVDKIETLRYRGSELIIRIEKYSVSLRSVGDDVGETVNLFYTYGTIAGTIKLEAVYKLVLRFISDYCEDLKNSTKLFK